MVHLLLGQIRKRYTSSDILHLDAATGSSLRTELGERLQQNFGLDQHEQEQALFAYAEATAPKLAVKLRYEEVMRQQGGIL